MLSQYNHRWINPKAKSYNSKIQGIGVVAIDNISKGEIVGVLGGIIIPKSKILEYRKHWGQAGIQIDDKFWICPTSREELHKTGIFNHSCDPNVGYSNSITLVAIRNIKRGEELVFDYATSETFFESFKCNCSSKNCRRIITKNDWKNKDIQKRLKNYFSPFLKKKISPCGI